MADLPETFHIDIDITGGALDVGSSQRVTSTIGLGVPGTKGDTGPIGPKGDKGDPGAGTGDVVGPASSVNNRIAVYNGITGKLLADGGKLISELANVVHSHPVADLSDATANGRSLITAANYAAMRTLLSLGAAALLNTGVAAGNVPVLDGSGKLDTSILPALAITDTFVVASQAAMLALTAEKGDIAIRTDLNKSFSLSTNSPGTLADWKELLTPTDAVLSVASLTGAISASALTAALNALVGDAGSGGTKGLAPAPAAGDAAAGKYLKADGTWATPSASVSLNVLAKSGNYSVVAGDKGKVVECSNTLTLSLLAAATAGDGFFFYVRVSASGKVVTIDPNSTEQIDGRTTVTGFVGDGVFIVVCDGTAWRTSRVKGRVLIDKYTNAGAVASADFETGFNGDAEIQTMEFKHWALSGASDANIWVRVKQGGSYASTTIFGHRVDYTVSSGAQSITNLGGIGELAITPTAVGNASNYSESGFLELNGINEATRRVCSIIGSTQVVAAPADSFAGAGRGCQFNACQVSAGVIQGVRFLMSAGNITAGTIYQYGVRS